MWSAILGAQALDGPSIRSAAARRHVALLQPVKPGSRVLRHAVDKTLMLHLQHATGTASSTVQIID